MPWFRSFSRRNRDLDELAQRVKDLSVAVAALADLDQRMDHLSDRVDVIERLLGVKRAQQHRTDPHPLEQLLEVRLGQLEGRIAAMLEGPYFERLVNELHPSSMSAD